MALLARFYQNGEAVENTLAALTRTLSEFAFHRHNVMKTGEPELEMFGPGQCHRCLSLRRSAIALDLPWQSMTPLSSGARSLVCRSRVEVYEVLVHEAALLVCQCHFAALK